MSDITKCSPTKLKPKCNSCYRMTAPTNKYRQSYSNFYDECDKYYWSVTVKPKLRISITASDYTKKMDKIIAKYNSSQIDEALIALLNEANKYVIRRKVVRKGNRKGGQKGYKKKKCRKK